MSSLSVGDPLRVLVVHRGLLQRRDESAEVEQHIVGLLDADVEVYGSDGRYVYQAVSHGARLEYCPQGRLGVFAIRAIDVVHVHMPIPLAHIGVALLARFAAVPVVLSPMGMLGNAYSESSWFRGPGGPFTRGKPLIVRCLRVVWRHLADLFVCLGAQEAADAHLPWERTAVVPWPQPQTWVRRDETVREPSSQNRDAPVAFISRMDIHRKGIDRLAQWLLTFADVLPRPAAVLFAPDNGRRDARLEEARRRGLLEWDTVTRGAKLQARLAECRGVALLSRWESFPRALREAALLGLPTISPPEAQFAEIVQRVRAGAVIDPGDPAAVQQAFWQIAGQQGDPHVAAALFNRVAVGQFLAMVLRAAAERRRPDPQSYYRWRDTQVAR